MAAYAEPSSKTKTTLRVRRAEGFIWAELDDEIVLMSVESGAYIGLNKTAAAFWRLLEQTSEVDAICARLAVMFAVEPQQCRRDVEGFVKRLSGQGALVVSVADAP